MTLANFLTYVKYDFKRTDKDTELTQFYNDAILTVSIKIPHGCYKYQSYVPLVAEQEDYPIPDNSTHIIHPIKYLQGSGTNDDGWQLTHITKQEYDKVGINPNRTNPPDTGEPNYYTIYSRSILIYPLPSSTEVTAGALLELDWTKTPTDQSDNSDTPSLGDQWREVLKQMTLSRAFSGVELYQESLYWRSLYEDGEGSPIGLYRDLLEREKDREFTIIGKVINNNL